MTQRICFWFWNLHRKSLSNHLRRHQPPTPSHSCAGFHGSMPTHSYQNYIFLSHPCDRRRSLPLTTTTRANICTKLFGCCLCAAHASMQRWAAAAHWRHIFVVYHRPCQFRCAANMHSLCIRMAILLVCFESFFVLSFNWHIKQRAQMSATETLKRRNKNKWNFCTGFGTRVFVLHVLENNKTLKMNGTFVVCAGKKHEMKWK